MAAVHPGRQPDFRPALTLARSRSGVTQTCGTTVSDFTTLQVGNPGRTIIIAANEQDLTGFMINGVSTSGSRLGQSSLKLSVAAIDQFKIHEGFFLPSSGPTTQVS